MTVSDAEAARLLLCSRNPQGMSAALHAYGVIVVSVERTASDGVQWTQVERTAPGTRTRRLASGPAGCGYWEWLTTPDGEKVWRLIRDEFYLPWKGDEQLTRLYTERAVFWEVWQKWVAAA